jgi:hypothetical protein
MHGPVINLINVVYLNPEYKYKLYVYLKDYDQMCYNGSLVSLKCSPSITRLLAYINLEKDNFGRRLAILAQLEEQEKLKDERSRVLETEKLAKENQALMELFASSKFKRWLIMIKLSIENGYWNSVSNLELIVDILSGLYRKKQEKVFVMHETYDEGHKQKNFMDSTVLIIDIAILYLDIQINLCLSTLIILPENTEDNRIQL